MSNLAMGQVDLTDLTATAPKPFAASQAAQASKLTLWLRRFHTGSTRVRGADMVIFLRHVTTLLRAGLPLSKALGTVAQQLESPALTQVVSQISQDVQGGTPLSAAMALHPAAFDELIVNVVKAGEAAGKLEISLEQLAQDLEKRQELRRAIMGALAYPAIVLSLGSILVTFLLIFVVPMFQEVYTKMKVELPFITQMLILASKITLKCWWLFPMVIGLAWIGWRRAKDLDHLKIWWERVLLRVPMVGKLRRYVITSRFLRRFATLIGSGVTIVEALHLISDLTPCRVLRKAIDDIRRHVSRGGRIGERMAQHGYIFSPMVIQMMSAGETAGTLPEAAEHTAEFLSQEADHRIKALTTFMEPLLTVVLGVVVGAIALAIYLPMFDLVKHVSK